MTNYLNNINSPADLKKLSVDQLPDLAEEIRQALLSRLMVTGGHAGPNLGMVEATIALHYVFDSPTDKFVFDVSHQCYVHKILTGRKDGFTDPERYGAYSGYTNPSESEHDMFTVGHTATALSLATGLAKARDLKGESGNVVAIVGDGSMSGGEAFEGLNNASMLGSNFILLFNDNEIAISPNYGGMYQNFAALRETNGTAECNFFKSFGMDYCYVSDGNDVQAMVEALQKVKDTDHPVVVHIHTEKGKGLSWNKENLEGSHFVMPGGSSLDDVMGSFESCGSIMAEHLLEKIKKDPTVIAISPATPGQSFLTPDFRQKAGMQFIDVGIAEEHAVTFACGLAAGGMRPVVAVYSTFLQRAYDQLLHDGAIEPQHVVLAVDRAGFIGSDGATHQGLFDAAFLSQVPGITIYSPATYNQLVYSFKQAMYEAEGLAAVRYPRGQEDTLSITLSGDWTHCSKDSSVLLITYGRQAVETIKAVESLAQEGKPVDLLVLNQICPIPQECIQLARKYPKILFIEEGILQGGIGEHFLCMLSEAPYYGRMQVQGVKQPFLPQMTLAEAQKLCGLDAASIVKRVIELFF